MSIKYYTSLWNYIYHHEPRGLEQVIHQVTEAGLGVELWPYFFLWSRTDLRFRLGLKRSNGGTMIFLTQIIESGYKMLFPVWPRVGTQEVPERSR